MCSGVSAESLASIPGESKLMVCCIYFCICFCLHVSSGSDSEPTAKKTKQCAPSAGADVVAPLGTSTMPLLWLEQGHALRIIDELTKRRWGGDTPRWLDFETSLFHTAAGELSGKFHTDLKYEISHNGTFPPRNPTPSPEDPPTHTNTKQ